MAELDDQSPIEMKRLPSGHALKVDDQFVPNERSFPVGP